MSWFDKTYIFSKGTLIFKYFTPPLCMASIFETIGYENIKVLRATSVDMTRIPPEIGKLNNLEEMNFNFGYILQIPGEIGMLRKLRRLECTNNLLISLPPELGYLQNLEYLNVSNNQITRLPHSLFDLPKARILYYGNPVSD